MAERNPLNIDLSRFEIIDGVDVCPLCLGAGVVVEVTDGVRRARPCDCRGFDVTRRRLAAVGIPPRYRDCGLENYNIVTGLTGERAADGKRLAISFADSYPDVDGGMLFMGPVGVGKTHLATGIIKRLALEKGVLCRWCDFADLLAAVRRRYSENAFDEYAILGPYLAADVLLLDDLGSMKIRDWTLDMLSYVINQRYVRNKLIVATTNYLDEVAGSEETLADRIGPRLRSRLAEMCKTVMLPGRDFRAHRQTGLLRNL